MLKDQSYLRDDAFFNSCAEHGIRYINFINQTIDRNTLIDLCVVALKLEEEEVAFVTEAVDFLVQRNKINLPIASVEDFIEACERIQLMRLENKPDIQEQLQVLKHEQEWVPLERDLLGLLQQQGKPSLQEFKDAFAKNGKGFPEDPNDANWPTEEIEEVYNIFLALEPNQKAVEDFIDKEILGENDDEEEDEEEEEDDDNESKNLHTALETMFASKFVRMSDKKKQAHLKGILNEHNIDVDKALLRKLTNGLYASGPLGINAYIEKYFPNFSGWRRRRRGR